MQRRAALSAALRFLVINISIVMVQLPVFDTCATRVFSVPALTKSSRVSVGRVAVVDHAGFIAVEKSPFLDQSSSVWTVYATIAASCSDGPFLIRVNRFRARRNSGGTQGLAGPSWQGYGGVPCRPLPTNLLSSAVL